MRGEYRPPIGDDKVIELLKAGRYKVDPHTAEVTGPKGKKITPYQKKGSSRLRVRLYGFGGVRSINRARLVWMSVTGEVPPKGFQIHHDDEISTNDAWLNLVCLHKLDHDKQHNGSARYEDYDIPI